MGWSSSSAAKFELGALVVDGPCVVVAVVVVVLTAAAAVDLALGNGRREKDDASKFVGFVELKVSKFDDESEGEKSFAVDSNGELGGSGSLGGSGGGGGDGGCGCD